MCKINYLTILVIASSCFVISCQQIEVRNPEEKPDENRFTKVVLTDEVDQPMELEILKDGRVLWVEREGKVKVYNPENESVVVLADIPSSVGYYSKTGEELSPVGEDGMQGIALDPNFEENHWVYLFYSPRDGRESGSILSRVEWQGDSLNMDTEIVMLEIPNQRQACCHLGGGMVFDKYGNLYLSTGDNTTNTGWTPIDERPGKARFDSQRSSGNANDLRGAILRIHPEPDGGYTIPEGNLFAVGTPNTKPEIYTMGNRNPWRLSIDSQTGWLYWGEVGPGGITDQEGRGPKCYDEFNQAREATNFGWPYFIADNKAYWEYDFESETSSEQFNPDRPINNSPNNTGIMELPPAEPAFIWYPQEPSKDFPVPGSGSTSAVGGPIYHRADFDNPARPYPAYYEGKWLITDWSRGWILVVTMDENGDYNSMEELAAHLTLLGPVDMDFGPDGDIYVLEYGHNPYRDSPKSVLSRIEFNGGNRNPVARLSADKTAGSAPLIVQLSSAGTKDYDGDLLRFEWDVVFGGKTIESSNETNLTATLSELGVYEATLTVTDPDGKTDGETIQIFVGNEPPAVSIDLKGANQSFYFPDSTINYAVQVYDKEDGSLAGQNISGVEVRIEYLSRANELNEILPELRNANAIQSLNTIVANQVMDQSDCKLCHQVDQKSLGPTYIEIAKKYKTVDGAINELVESIISGSTGKWGEGYMTAHATLSTSRVTEIVKYILSLPEQENSRPVMGSYAFEYPYSPNSRDGYVFRAFYTDKGNHGISPLSTVNVLTLRNPVVQANDVDISKDVVLEHTIINRDAIIPKGTGSYAGLKNIDLTGINQIEFNISPLAAEGISSGGIMEVRIDAPDGWLIGQTDDINVIQHDRGNRTNIAADIIAINDVRDIYFVYRHTAEDKEVQIRIWNFTFGNARPPEAF